MHASIRHDNIIYEQVQRRERIKRGFFVEFFLFQCACHFNTYTNIYTDTCLCIEILQLSKTQLCICAYQCGVRALNVHFVNIVNSKILKIKEKKIRIFVVLLYAVVNDENRRIKKITKETDKFRPPASK